MNKSDLISELARKKNLSYKVAGEIVNLIFDNMADALVSDDRIEIRGFGSFTVREYGAYTGRNPNTGKLIKVQPKKSPFFKVGKELKDRLIKS